jgi:5-hydroxyisourate hydrolase-like protein (transthyretin family)
VPSEGLIAPKGTNLAIKGTASGSNFQSYELEYGRGAPPQNWILITSSQSPVENGLLGNLQLTEFGHYTIRLSVTDKSGRIFEDMNTVFAVADMQEGFPLDTGDYIFTSSPTVSDINEDGKKEILIGNYKGVYAYDYKGQSLPGWPIYFGPSEHSDFYTISVADLDPNYPGKEIAVTTYVTTVRPSLGYLHLYHADGTEITSGGWPKLMSGTPASASFLTTALADLDNDGELEIIQPSTKVIDVWKLNGGALPGWPKILDITAIEQPIAVGNIDDDPELEIVVVGWLNIPAPPPKDYRSIDKLFVLNSDGSYVNGFPMVFDEHCANAPVLADLDKDSRLEIIFQVGQRDVYAFKGDGTVLNGWPFPTTAGTGAYSKTVHPAIGDIDDDGFLEVIVCSGNEIFAINHDGSLVEGWPALGSNLYFNPVIGDIDGDGDSEILANSFMPTEVHAWHHNGQIVEGFPIPIEGGGYIFNSPAIADLDNDLDMELIVAPFTGYLYVYDFQEKYPEGQLINEWPMFNQSPQHTGNYPSYSNRPPVLDPIGNKTIDEDKLLQFLVSATDPDGDQLTYSAMDLPQGANFYPTSQTFSWIPTYSQAGAYNVTFSVSDGKGGEDSETITITVNNVNRAPVLEPIGNKVVNTGELLSFAVTATDPDGSILTYSASNLPSGATFNKATRVFSWTPSRSQAGTYQVHFEVTDGEINDSEDITITVTWLNHPPVANNQSVSVVKNTPKNIVLAASDPDADPLTYIVVNPPAYGILSGNAPALTYQPQTGYAGSDSFTFKVRDGQLDSNVATVSITVNSAPVANNQAVILAEDTSQAITLIATDADGDSLTYNIMNNPIHGKITGTAPNVIYTPQANYFGTDSFTFRAYDGKVYSNTATVSITVNNINDPPVLADIGNKTVNEGVRLSFSISASDADRDVLTYSAANLPAGAIFTASTRSFSWTPAFDQADTYSLTFNVSDGKGGEDSETITITVNNVNHAPVLAAIGNKTLYEGKLLSFTASASDADNDPLVYSATGIPPGATFDPLTRVFSWAPNFSQAGTYYVNFMVKDNLGVSDSERITITVYNTFLTGIVRDGKTKAPLSQVSVEVFQKIDRSYVFVTLATTDAQGRYVAEKSLSAGRYMLRVSADGYVTRTVYFSLVAGQTATVNINLGYPRYLRYRR